ncbi:MAG TPA: tRNA (adenosine(37)-N6)-dimethylallyltransferase MiaA [Cytophagales bacterium]|nr:tRNA (adenosine(37)-N6)-dimethylallyltransferase MiaA [Cytophagales bacterium]
MDKTIIVIVGPTAVGKTSLAIRLAQHFDTDVLSADSRQFYKEMSLGTAKPTVDEMKGVRHHFIDSLSILQTYTAGDFERDALTLLDHLFKKRDVVVVAGGSGMYVKALCEGLDDMPEHNENLRVILNAEAERDYDVVVSRLKELDPIYYSQVDLSNKQRVVRALEVCIGTGGRFSDYRSAEKRQRPFKIIKIGLERDRAHLYQAIDDRMDMMLDKGLLEEAKSLFAFKHTYALQTIGYSEIYSFLNGEYDWNECVRVLKRNSRRYAKKQLTWFKKDPEVRWFDVEAPCFFESVMQKVQYTLLKST